MRTLPARLALGAILAALSASPVAAQQRGTDREFRWGKAVAADSWVRLHNVTGDVTVTATDGDRVEVVATRRGNSDDPDVRVEVEEYSGGVSVCVLYSPDDYCDRNGVNHDSRNRRRRYGNDDRAYYNLEVRVPRRQRVVANTVSGDVRVTGTQNELRAASVSGDVTVDRARAMERLSATSVSGEVVVSLDQVTDRTEMSFTSVSGDVRVTMPQNTGVDLSMSTVSGELQSDFTLNVRGRMSRNRISATIGNGASDMRVSTVSGDVRLAARN